MTEYKVQIDIYNGPLDLLLYLIRREELDIYDIPIARITEQYLAYVSLLRALDPEAAAEFLVLAATLMEIKSRMLLPRAPAEEGQEEENFDDPRLELVRQLLEYKKYKDAAFDLDTLRDEHSKRFQRQPASLTPGEKTFDLEDAQIWDLFAAFNQLMAEVGRTPTAHEVLYDDTPISLHAADIQDRLIREGGSLQFKAIFEGRTKSEMIGLFLAILELVRQKRVRAEQEQSFGPIFLHLLDETPITEASLISPDVETAETEHPEEEQEEFPLEPVSALDEPDEEFVDAEMAEFDASLERIATEVDEEKERLIRQIDRLMDVEAALDDTAPGEIEEGAPAPADEHPNQIRPQNVSPSEEAPERHELAPSLQEVPEEHPTPAE